MAFPGTLSIHPEHFQAILVDTASSLKAHGFRRIIFIGDSGGNQEGQTRVARDLSQKWEKEGVRVDAASDYYLNNHQIDYLESLGYDKQSIGLHAGIRETSEMLYLDPKSVRSSLLPSQPSTVNIGSDGAPELASPALGKALTNLKIEAAVKAIQSSSVEP